MNILITGANRGLGFSLAVAAAEAGHRVIAAVRGDSSRLEALDSLAARYPGAVVTVEFDVSDEASVAAAAATLEREVGSLDAIVNNAAILLGREQRIESVNFDQLRESFEVNLFGAMRVVKHMLPLLRKSSVPGSKASIVNISSEAGSFSNAYGADYPYALTKAAMNMFSQQLASYAAEDDIAVLAVHPGWMRTDMGGSQAPLDPMDSARSILTLVTREKEAGKGQYVFVDFEGKDMQI
jgi:NAD(P)-dependent dehydrogenase (short-subunit alcohol dehydrogenase family)